MTPSLPYGVQRRNPTPREQSMIEILLNLVDAAATIGMAILISILFGRINSLLGHVNSQDAMLREMCELDGTDISELKERMKHTRSALRDAVSTTEALAESIQVINIRTQRDLN